MSKQFSFYLTPKDSIGLKIHLSEILGGTFLADESKEPKPVGLSELLPNEIEEETMIYLARTEDLVKIHFDEIENRKIWSIDSLRSPVIEFSNCYFDRRRIGPGRMYYTTGYFEDDGSWTDKDPQFLEWAKKVFAVAKKSLKRDKELDAYIGHEALELYKARKIKLVSFV